MSENPENLALDSTLFTEDLSTLSTEELIERCQLLQIVAYKFHLLAQKTTELFLNDRLTEGFTVSFSCEEFEDEDLDGAGEGA